MTEQRPLPEFDAPPVDEVVLGVDFSPLDFKVPYFGLFWSGIRGEYPRCDVQPLVISQIETFPQPHRGQPTIPAFFGDSSAVRCWFLNEPETELIQLQPDRFMRNWRRVKGAESYPRYAYLRPRFETDWGRFLKFMEENRLKLPEVVQCEVTYVNNIEKGEGWETFADLARVTPLWSGSVSENFLPSPESASVAVAYTMERELGRLRVNLSHAFRLRDGKEILQFQLVARGKPASASPAGIMDWLDHGREWIVRAFTDLTTPEMHKIWRRTR